MRVSLLTVSNRQPRWVLDGCAEYEKRLPRAWRFQVQELKPEPRTLSASAPLCLLYTSDAADD